MGVEIFPPPQWQQWQSRAEIKNGNGENELNCTLLIKQAETGTTPWWPCSELHTKKRENEGKVKIAINSPNRKLCRDFFFSFFLHAEIDTRTENCGNLLHFSRWELSIFIIRIIVTFQSGQREKKIRTIQVKKNEGFSSLSWLNGRAIFVHFFSGEALLSCAFQVDLILRTRNGYLPASNSGGRFGLLLGM